MMGQGYIFADWILTILVILCALVHVAVLRAPDLPESKIIEHIRMIKIAGFSIVAMRYVYVLYVHGDIYIQPATELGLILIFGAEFYRTLYRLFQHKMDVQYEIRARRRKTIRGS